MNPISISPSEWNVLELLWEDSPQTLSELVPKLNRQVGWSKSTTATMVRRMSEKGLLRFEIRGRGKLFFPNVERNDVVAQETDSLLHRAYRGSIGLMVSAMAQRSPLTKEDIDELYQILKEAEEKAK